MRQSNLCAITVNIHLSGQLGVFCPVGSWVEIATTGEDDPIDAAAQRAQSTLLKMRRDDQCAAAARFHSEDVGRVDGEEWLIGRAMSLSNACSYADHGIRHADTPGKLGGRLA